MVDIEADWAQPVGGHLVHFFYQQDQPIVSYYLSL